VVALLRVDDGQLQLNSDEVDAEEQGRRIHAVGFKEFEGNARSERRKKGTGNWGVGAGEGAGDVQEEVRREGARCGIK